MGKDNKDKPVKNAQGQSTQMDLGHTPPSPVLATALEDKNLLNYDLIVKPSLSGEPQGKELWLDEKISGNKVSYSVRDLDGKIVNETLDLTKIKLDTDMSTKTKLMQDWVNLNKKLILEGIRAQTAARLFKNTQELAASKTEEEQAEISKEFKKRLRAINENIQNPRPEDMASNLEGMRHLSTMSMEGLAIKMVIDELMWILKSVALVQYRIDQATYNKLAASEPELVYDLSKGADKTKPLYAFKFVGDKIKLDKTKPIEVVNGKLQKKNKPDDYSDSMIIMANGYLPPPTILRSLKKEFSAYAQKQVASIIDQDERNVEAAFYKAKKSKSKEGAEGDEDATRDRLMAQNMAARPKPTPTGK